MPPGTKPQPPELKLVRGNPGKRPVPRPPKQKPGLPFEPNWFDVLPGTDDRAKQMRLEAAEAWAHLAPILDAQGVLSPAHLEALRDYSVCVAEMHDAIRQMSRDGSTPNSTSGRRAHPVTPLLNQCRSQFRFYVAEFGLTPVSAGRLPGAGKGSDADRDAAWG